VPLPRAALVRAVLAAGALAAAACDGSLSPSALRATRSELNVARRRWTAQGPRSYRYRFQYLCFCPASLVTPVEIEVRDGRVAAVIDPASGRPAAPAPGRPSPTVEDLFAIVESALDRDVDWLDVQYDIVLGYPAVIRVDPNTRAVDEEQSYFAGGLRSLDQDQGQPAAAAISAR
jgi:hypothetical protein